MFPDDRTCASYLSLLRWPDGFVCPSCKIASTPWNESRGRLTCPTCRHEASVTERKQLSGNVEVDETFVYDEGSDGKRGRGTTKSIVVIAVEMKEPKGFGRVRMRYVPDASGKSLLPFVRDVVAPGSVVRTDGWKAYNRLPDYGYTREVVVLSSSGDPAHVSMPGVHRVSSLLKRWFLGTHQGSISPNHLQSYLEEYTFRFNRRASKSRGLLFRRLLEQAVVTNPATMADIIHGYDWKSV